MPIIEYKIHSGVAFAFITVSQSPQYVDINDNIIHTEVKSKNIPATSSMMFLTFKNRINFSLRYNLSQLPLILPKIILLYYILKNRLLQQNYSYY